MQLLADLVARVRAEIDSSKLKEFHKELGDGTKEASGKGILGLAGIAAGGLVMGGAIIGAGKMAVDALGGMVDKALEANKGIAQTNAVLASTHGVSGMTAASVGALADRFKNLDGVDDDVVRGAENMLLTFTNIHKDTFPAATQAALDMSAALGEDATSASMQLGKALNDPVAGVTALQRVGVKLTDTQKQNIADAVKHGQVAKAQGIILKELGTEFGGSAKAAGDAAGPMNKLNIMWSDMQKQIGNALLPIINKLADSVMPLVTAFGDWLPGALDSLTKSIMPAVTAIGNFFKPMADNKELMSFLKQALPYIAIIIGGVLVGALVAAAVAAWALVAPLLIAAAPFIAIGIAIALVVIGIKLLIEHWGQLTKLFSIGMQLIGQMLGGFFSSVGEAIGGFFSGIGTWLHNLGTSIAVWTAQQLARFGAWVGGVIQWFTELPGKIWGIVSSFIVGIATRFVDMELRGLAIIGGFIMGVLQFFGGLPGRVFSFLAELVGGLIGRFVDMELRGLGIITNFISGLIGKLWGAIGQAAAAIGGVKDAILGALGDLGGRLAKLATDAIHAMISAILGMAGAVGNAIGGLFSNFHLPHFASGGIMQQSGFALVGERGPEVVALPAGAQVYPHGASPLINSGAPRVAPSTAGGRGAASVVEVVFQLDGREVARQLWPALITEAQLSGVRLG